MSGLYNLFFGTSKEEIIKPIFSEHITISVAETVTAGALSNAICSEPGASDFFKGGIITYNEEANKNLLGIDLSDCKDKNYANEFVTLQMAKKVAEKFGSRVGMANTGYSLPTIDANGNKIDVPYFITALIDIKTGFNKIRKKEVGYDGSLSKKINRANVQSKAALIGKEIFNKHCEYQKKHSKVKPEPIDIKEDI